MIRTSAAALAQRLQDWNPSGRRFALFWLAAALAILALYLPTFTISPPVWTDEAHIVEYGRLFLEPLTDWSLFWQADGPVIPWYYLGPLLQYAAERASAPSCWGPRLSSVVGGLFASGMLAAWMRARGALPAAAFLLGLLYLFEPVFAAAYRGGRLDGWTLGLGVSSGYLIAASADPRSRGRLRVVCAGVLVVIGFFVWPSVVFLLPLLAFELVRVARQRAQPPLALLLPFAIASAATLICLAVPVLLHVPGLLDDVPRQLGRAGMSTSEAARFDLQAKLSTLLRTAVVSFWHVPILVACLRSPRSRPILALMLIPGTLVFVTMLYSNRMLYLVAYVVLAFSECFPASGARPPAAESMRNSNRWLLAGAVTCAALVTIGLRTANAWMQREARSEHALVAAARAAAPAGSSVCLEPIEFYFTGLTLGWKMYTIAPDVLPLCDAAVIGSSSELEPALAESGFRIQTTLLAQSKSAPPAYGGQGFGPYRVYRRIEPRPTLAGLRSR